jgi:hypothetical protein
MAGAVDPGKVLICSAGGAAWLYESIDSRYALPYRELTFVDLDDHASSIPAAGVGLDL